MKNTLYLLLLIVIIGCKENNNDDVNNYSDVYREITGSFTTQDFELTKTFILDNGDRQTYCTMYNNNPHYTFDYFESYLNPEIGQQNINCDPAISDFNELVIRDRNTKQQYYHIFIVRPGDIGDKKINVHSGMEEDRVYLLKYHDYNLDSAEYQVGEYIEVIKDII